MQSKQRASQGTCPEISPRLQKSQGILSTDRPETLVPGPECELFLAASFDVIQTPPPPARAIVLFLTWTFLLGMIHDGAMDLSLIIPGLQHSPHSSTGIRIEPSR